jgi:hypothetical protein
MKIRCLRQAMGAIANISERQETHPSLRKNQVHNEVIGHFLNNDVCVVREASRVVTNMAALHENHPPLVSGGGLKVYMKFQCF